MLFEKLNIQNSILETAMVASTVRNEVIQNNIANAELPGFKKSKVNFENILQDTLQTYKQTGKLDLSKATARVALDNENFSYRLDGNNVDIESEMIDLYQNSVKYETLTSGVMNNYKRINLALSLK